MIYNDTFTFGSNIMLTQMVWTIFSLCDTNRSVWLRDSDVNNKYISNYNNLLYFHHI